MHCPQLQEEIQSITGIEFFGFSREGDLTTVADVIGRN